MKFVVTDLDGTLLYSRNVVTDYTKTTLKKLNNKGIHFAIATGRGIQGVQAVLKQLNMDIYLICNNGANIYDPQGKCIFESTIPKDISIAILKEIRKNGLFFSAFLNDVFYYDKDDQVENFHSRHLFKESILDNYEECPALNKIIVGDDNPEVVSNIAQILKKKFGDLAEVMVSQPTCLDIAPKGCSKGTGIKNLANIFNISHTEFMAFGDGENDIEMLRTAGHPVVMANAQDILKKEFSNLTNSNTEDGVAKYLEKYFNL